jgi:hypothetical protein
MPRWSIAQFSERGISGFMDLWHTWHNLSVFMQSLVIWVGIIQLSVWGLMYRVSELRKRK